MAQEPKTQLATQEAPASQGQAAQPPAQVVKTALDIANEKDAARNKARLDRDDAARERAKQVTMICVSPFTLVEDPDLPGRVIRAGEEITVSAFDVDAYTGRCRLKLDPGDPDQVLERNQGPQISRT